MKKIKPTIKLSDSGNLHIHIPMFIRRMRGRKMVFTPDTLDGENEGMPETVQTAIVQSLARAFSWADILESGEISPSASWQGISMWIHPMSREP